MRAVPIRSCHMSKQPAAFGCLSLFGYWSVETHRSFDCQIDPDSLFLNQRYQLTSVHLRRSQKFCSTSGSMASCATEWITSGSNVMLFAAALHSSFRLFRVSASQCGWCFGQNYQISSAQIWNNLLRLYASHYGGFGFLKRTGSEQNNKNMIDCIYWYYT